MPCKILSCILFQRRSNIAKLGRKAVFALIHIYADSHHGTRRGHLCEYAAYFHPAANYIIDPFYFASRMADFSIARRTATAPHAVISLISSGVASPVPSKKRDKFRLLCPIQIACRACRALSSGSRLSRSRRVGPFPRRTNFNIVFVESTVSKTAILFFALL